MAKPTISDTRFGVDGSDVDASNLSAPISGLRDTGWPTNAVPTSGNFNYLFRKIHAWFQWLDGLWGADGSLTLDEDADLTLQGDGNITVDDGDVILTNGDLVVSSGDLGVTGGSMAIGGDLNVVGDLTIGGEITGDLDVGGTVTCTDLHHTDAWEYDIETESANTSDATFANSNVDARHDGVQATADGGTWRSRSLTMLRTGDRIDQIIIDHYKSTGGTTTIELCKTTFSGGAIRASIETHTYSTSGYNTDAWSVPNNHVVASGERWYLFVTFPKNTDTVYGARIKITRP